MFEKTKARILLFCVIAIFVSIISLDTYGYYTTTGTGTNVVTSGSIKLVIHEMTDQGVEFPKEGVYVMPGDVVGKQVSIENICDHPFYLRVRIVYSTNDASLSADECFKLNIDENLWTAYNGWYYYNGIVEPGQMTPYIFSLVEIVGSEVDNRFLGKTLTLTVDAQAIQSENNPIEDGKYYTSSGWPIK